MASLTLNRTADKPDFSVLFAPRTPAAGYLALQGLPHSLQAF